MIKTLKYSIPVILILLFIPLWIYAKELKVESFAISPSDLTAHTSPERDRNGELCAVIKVTLPESAKFEGNVIKTVYDVNEYLAYYTAGTKKMAIKLPDYETLFITFPTSEFPDGLEAGVTYRLKLSGLETSDKPQGSDAGGNWVIFEITPREGASLKVNGKPQTVENGQAMIYLPYGLASFIVEAPGYLGVDGVVNVQKGEKYVQIVTLKSILAQVKIESQTPGADISINGAKKGSGTWSGTLNPGFYHLEVSKEGYEPYEQSIELKENDNQTISIPALTPLYASLNIGYKPIGSEVYLDGQKVGTTPLILNNLIAGKHKVEIKFKDYQDYSASISLKEQETYNLEGELTLKKEEKPKQDKKNKDSNNPEELYTKGMEDYNQGKYYPEAYEDFLKYAEVIHDKGKVSEAGEGYNYAGISAYKGNELEKASEAFEKAYNLLDDDPEPVIYAIACWHIIASDDTSRKPEALTKIEKLAWDGLTKYGIDDPIFINELIRSYLDTNRSNRGMSVVNSYIKNYPDNPNLYCLRAYIYERIGDKGAAEANYLKAINYKDASLETLRLAGDFLYKTGVEKLDNVWFNTNDQNEKIEISENYFQKALEIASRGLAINPEDKSFKELKEHIEYTLSTYF